MYKTINQDDFANAFLSNDTYKYNFTRAGLYALWDYLTDLETVDENESIDTRIEFDMVAIACEYSEYDSAWEAMDAYEPDDMPVADSVEKQESLALAWLQDRTAVISFNDGIIIADF